MHQDIRGIRPIRCPKGDSNIKGISIKIVANNSIKIMNHLVIGLGGTGGSILRDFRRRSYEYFSAHPEKDTKGNTIIDYIYVDSNEDDLKASNLDPNQKVNIHGMGGGVLDNLQAYPSMRAFITDEDRAILKQDDQVSMIIDTGIGGQRRRFGRMLLANNVMTNPLNGFSAVLKDRIVKMNNSSTTKAEITFHICAGLAGGTGSGSIIDAIAQLHKIVAPMGNTFDVLLYLYVPEILVASKYDAGYYHANGYAALREINAIALEKYHPTDIGGEIDHLTGKIRRLISGKNAKPFKQVYLFSDRNNSDYILPKENKLPAAVADFLFQRIIANEATDTSRLNMVLNCENNPGPAEQDESGENVRSRNFISFGITRIVYPETEIKTYAQEKSTSAALTGLLYNKWVNTQGYINQTDETAGVGIEAKVKLPGTEDALHLSDKYLTLQAPVENFVGSDSWNQYNEYWNNYCSYFYEDIVSTEKDRYKWTSKFLDICTTEFTSNFRGLGINEFFNTWSTPLNVNNYAACITKHIEKFYFNKWINGLDEKDEPMSLLKVHLYLRALGKVTSARIPKISDVKAGVTQEAEAYYKAAEVLQSELNATGFFAHMLLAKARQKFALYQQQMAKWYAAQTYIKACDFASLLLTELVSRLNELDQYVLKLNNLFIMASHVAESMAQNSCQKQSEHVGKDVQIELKLYDTDKVRSTIETKVLKDAETLPEITKNIRQQMEKLVKNSGKENCFQTLFELLGGNDNVSIIDSVPTANQAHKEEIERKISEKLILFIKKEAKSIIDNKLDQVGKADPNAKLLGVNILDKIQQEYPSETMLRNYLQDLINRTQCFLKMTPTEIGIGEKMLTDAIQICVPEHPSYRSHFIQVFQEACEGAVFDETSSIADSPKSNEIVIIRIASNLLLRYSQNVAFLKQKYDGMVSEFNPKHKLNKVLLHTETLDDSIMPDLFTEGPEVLHKKMLRTAILMHSVENLFTKGIDPTTGNPIQQIQIGSIFDGTSYTVGKDVTETTKLLENDYNMRRVLVKYVDQFVQTNYKSDVEKQHLQKLIENMIISVVLPKANNNNLDPLFQEYVGVAKEIFKNM